MPIGSKTAGRFSRKDNNVKSAAPKKEPPKKPVTPPPPPPLPEKKDLEKIVGLGKEVFRCAHGMKVYLDRLSDDDVMNDGPAWGMYRSYLTQLAAALDAARAAVD